MKTVIYRFLFLIPILIRLFVHFFVPNHVDNRFPCVFVFRAQFVGVTQLPIGLLDRHQVDQPMCLNGVLQW